MELKRLGGPGTCELCGKTAELRPYGPAGMSVCFECMLLDEATAKEEFKKLMGDSPLIVGVDDDGEPVETSRVVK